MRFDFCIPTRGTKVPHTPDWLHEIKYDGYRLRVERDGDRVRLFTRNGYDWTKRYPWIVESALKNRQKHFIIDGEAVVHGVDGVSDFNDARRCRAGELRCSLLNALTGLIAYLNAETSSSHRSAPGTARVLLQIKSFEISSSVRPALRLLPRQ
jgi:ATP dependent DNA ligase domain